MSFKKAGFYLFETLIAIALSVAALEASYYVFTRVIKREASGPGPGEVNFHTTGIFIKDKDACWALKPGASTSDLPDWERKKEIYNKRFHGLGKRISTNKAGYRGRLYDVVKGKKTIRILVLGGSTTWGVYNDDGATWPEQLERILRRRVKGKKIEVINAAAGGYSSVQNLAMVNKVFQYYEPDIVLDSCWFNDMYNRSSRGSYVGPHADFNVNRLLAKCREDKPERRLYPFRGGRAVGALLAGKFHDLRFRLTTRADDINKPKRPFFSKFYTPDKVWLRNYLANVSELIRIVRTHEPGAEYFIVAMPTFLAPASAEGFSDEARLPSRDIPLYERSYIADSVPSRFLFALYYYHTILFQEYLEARSAGTGYRMILGYPALGKTPVGERGRYFTDGIHLTDEGNRLLASEIARQLLGMSDKFR